MNPKSILPKFKINSQKEIKKPSITENLHAFCKNTTFHGLKFVGDDELNWFERSFFGVAFIIIFLVSSYFIIDVYGKWSSTPVIVTISSKSVKVNEIPFPAITICNEGKARKDIVDQIKNNSDDMVTVRLLCNRDIILDADYNNNTSNSSNSGNSNLITNLIDSAIKSPTSGNWTAFETKIFTLSMPCEKMLLQCKYSSTIIDCKKAFKTTLTDDGLCCVFNGVHETFMYKVKTLQQITPEINEGQHPDFPIPIKWTPEIGYTQQQQQNFFYPRVSTSRGASKGLSVVLDAQIDNYFCSSSNGPGFKIAMHSPVESPAVKETGFIAPTGHQSQIRITPKIVQTTDAVRDISQKSRECFYENEKTLLFYQTYTKKNCQLECEAQMYFDNCGCIRYFIPKLYTNFTVCSPKNRDCMMRMSYQNYSSTDKVTKCDDICLPGCTEIAYVPDIFSIPLRFNLTYKIYSTFIANMSNSRIRDLAVLNFYFRDSEFFGETKDQYIGMTEFLSYTGGLMSLFMGFSFISIMEIFYFASLRPLFALYRFMKQKDN